MTWIKFKKIARKLINIFKIFLSLFLVPFFIIQTILFLLKNLAIFKNDLVYVFWNWSFGHTVIGLDYAARLYYPHRVSLVYIPHIRSNRFLPFCFQTNFDVFFCWGLKSHSLGNIQYLVVRFVILILSALTNRFQVIEHTKIVYKTLSVANGDLLVGVEERGVLDNYDDYTGYLRLLRDGVGRPPALPNDLASRCMEAIKKEYPDFFDQPFIAVLLRKKGERGAFHDASRCAGPHKNYHDAVKYLTNQGYNVVGLGETEHMVFSDIPGYYSLLSVDIDYQLLNLFILMKSVLFIGQQSGPYVLANTCNIPSLICDAIPYRVGTFNKDDLIVFKHLRFASSNQYLSIAEVFRHHEDLIYGYHYSEKSIVIEPNSPQEILEAVKEMVSKIRGEIILTPDDQLLIDKFRRLPNRNTSLHYQQNRLPLFMLRKMRVEL